MLQIIEDWRSAVASWGMQATPDSRVNHTGNHYSSCEKLKFCRVNITWSTSTPSEIQPITTRQQRVEVVVFSAFDNDMTLPTNMHCTYLTLPEAMSLLWTCHTERISLQCCSGVQSGTTYCPGGKHCMLMSCGASCGRNCVGLCVGCRWFRVKRESPSAACGKEATTRQHAWHSSATIHHVDMKRFWFENQRFEPMVHDVLGQGVINIGRPYSTVEPTLTR